MIILNEFSSTEGPKLYRENIYAGAVMVRKPTPLASRKILFQLFDGETVDLLYDSPNYNVSTIDSGVGMDKIFIGHTVNITPALEKHCFPFELTDKDVRKIYKLFLHPNSDFLKCEDAFSPLSKYHYEMLRKLSRLSKQPNIFEIDENPNKFKKKVKTYTFK